MSEFSAEEEVNKILMNSPHVVILGAGASRAACPNGNRNGKVLPLMNDLISVVKLDYLADLGLNIKKDFETLYSLLYRKKKYKKMRQQVENQVYNYFNEITIPESPTIYDLLLLSLRKKDLVAIFNWDPLIVQAYRRNGNKFELPNLLFLHGNVGAGYCETHNQSGLKRFPCNTCGKPLEKTPLLYPITEKNLTQLERF